MKAWWKEPTRAQWYTFGGAWLGWVLDAFDFTIFLLVMPSIAQEFGVSITATAGVVTLTLFVRFLGGAAAGYLADRWGRKLPLMLSIAWYALCDGAIALAPSFGWVLALRVLFGFGMGAEWTAGTTLLMENWPERSRGIIAGIMQSSWCFGYLLAGVAAGWVVPQYGWRALFLIAMLPALLVIPIRFMVPESPLWRQKAAAPESASFQELLASPILKNLLWGCGLMALGLGDYYAQTSLYPTMLQKEMGMNNAGLAPYVVLFNLGGLMAGVLNAFLITRFSIGFLILIFTFFGLLFLPLYLGAWPQGLAWGAFLEPMFVITGLGPLLAGLFPVYLRARAIGMVYHIGPLCASFVPTATAAFSSYSGLSLAWAMGGACVFFKLGLALCMLWQRKRLQNLFRGVFDR